MAQEVKRRSDRPAGLLEARDGRWDEVAGGLRGHRSADELQQPRPVEAGDHGTAHVDVVERRLPRVEDDRRGRQRPALEAVPGPVAGHAAAGVGGDHVGARRDDVPSVCRPSRRVERTRVLRRHRRADRQRQCGGQNPRLRAHQVEDDRPLVGDLDARDVARAAAPKRLEARQRAEVGGRIGVRDRRRERAFQRVAHVLGADLAMYRRTEVHPGPQPHRHLAGVARDDRRRGGQVGDRLRASRADRHARAVRRQREHGIRCYARLLADSMRTLIPACSASRMLCEYEQRV